MPKISVIVPVYKVEPYLHRCVDSILAQTFSDFELILVDDGSPDRCPAICDEYAQNDRRVHVIHQENGGLSAARNAGIDWSFANSDSQWLTFIDSDDWVPDIYLELLLHAALTLNVKVSMCWLYPTSRDTPALSDLDLAPIIRTPEQAFTMNGKEISAYAQGRLYAKECYETIRFPVGKLFEDVFTTHRVIFAQKEIAVIEAPLYFYFINANGIVQAPWSIRKMDLYEAMEQQIAFFDEQGYPLALRIQIRRYLTSVEEKINLLSNQPENKHELIHFLREKKKCNFAKYAKKLNVDDPADAWVLTKIYPKRMWLYWHTKALIRKLKTFKG